MTGLRLAAILRASALDDCFTVPQVDRLPSMRPWLTLSTIRTAFEEAVQLGLFVRSNTSYEVRYHPHPLVSLNVFSGTLEGPTQREERREQHAGEEWWRDIRREVTDPAEREFGWTLEKRGVSAARSAPAGFARFKLAALATYAEYAEQIVVHLGSDASIIPSRSWWRNYERSRAAAFARWTVRLAEARREATARSASGST